MKSRVMVTQKTVRAAVTQEVKDQMKVICQDAGENGAYQALATVFCVLSREYGWGKKRLTRLKNQVEDEFVLMKYGVIGSSYTTADCCAHLKKRYGIDFSESQYRKDK